jgi:uncharacterized membrane protein YfcA
MLSASLLVLAGAFAGGLVSGLTGFGTGMVALPIWLIGLTPALASPLVVICSLIGQFQTLPSIWHTIDFRRCLPFIAGGLIGVPFGAYLLPYISIEAFRIAIGVLLVIYCTFSLSGRGVMRVRGGGRIADGLVGLGGGVLGGLAGLSGPLPTIWSALRGWGKAERRSVLQTYGTAILGFALVAQFFTGLITAEVGWLVLIALPGTVLGSWIGQRAYGKLDNAKFEKVVLTVLLVSGIAMIAGGVFGKAVG